MPCSPGMKACRQDCLHRRSVEDYRLERIHQEDLAEQMSNGWDEERSAWLEQNPLITFKDWLMR